MVPHLWLGSLRVSTYTIMLASAVIVFMAGTLLRTRLRGGAGVLSLGDTIDALFYVVLAACAGIYLSVLLTNAVASLAGFARAGSWWAGRTQFAGVIAAGALAWIVYARLRRISLGPMLDVAAPALGLAFATVKVGCLMAGCCYGRLTTGLSAMFLPDPAGYWAWRFPTQVISIVAGVLICLSLLAIERRLYGKGGQPPAWGFHGFLFLLYLMLHCGLRFGLEFLAADSKPVLGPLTWTHFYCLVGMAVAFWLLVRNVHGVRRFDPVFRSPQAG